MSKQAETPNKLSVSPSVEATGALLKRWYVLERAAMRALAGWLPGIEAQEIKSLAARHLWMSAMSADRLRTRILELRSPRRDVDRKWDPALVRLTQTALNAPDSLSFVGGVYRVLQTALEDAYRQAETNNPLLADAPSGPLLRYLLDQKQTQLAEMLPLLSAAEQRNPAERERREQWTEDLCALLAACGGANGLEAVRDFPASTLEQPFARPLARRDPRYKRQCELIGHSPYFWQSQDPAMIWTGYAVAHFNELWASEMAAAVLYMNPDAPWNLQVDAARWCYDEARHFELGRTRLVNAGADIYEDVPAPDTITFNCYEPDWLQQRLLAVHGFERGGVVGGGKQAAMKWHQQAGDTEGGQHFDFDWADESIHLQYGVEWLRHLYGEEILDANLDTRITEAIEHRGRLIRAMFETEGDEIEPHILHLCGKVRAPVQADPSASVKATRVEG